MRLSPGIRAQLLFVIAMLSAAAIACNSLLDFDGFTFGEGDAGSTADGSSDAGDADGSNDGCIDPTGFGGRGCFRCTPTNNEELLNACPPPDRQFEPFDNATRIEGFDPNDPRPALVDGGPTPPPFDAGVTTPTDSGVVTVPDCDFSSKPNPVIVFGATGFPMDVIAKAMGSEATMYYLEKGSCVSVANLILNEPKAGDGPSNSEVVVFDNTSGSTSKCRLPSVMQPDINLAALFAESCAGQNGLSQDVQLPAGVTDLLGPVNPVMLAVPATSTERVISAEAAYKVYGFGYASGVAPWTDENYIFRRTGSSGNQQCVARTLGLPLDGLRGRDSSGSSNMKNALQQSDQPQKTIGISASEIIDINRDVMKSLAYQHYGQKVGFYPDSSPGAFDRRNVRDGHYFMWIPLHVLVRINSAGDPVAAQNQAILDAQGLTQPQRDATVKKLAYVMVNRQEAPVKSVDLFGALKTVGNVPQCAMRVTRTREGAPLTPFTPSTSCACAFEAASPGTNLPECKPCTSDVDCPGDRPTCSFGFCE